MNDLTLGQRIAHRRRRRGLSQVKLAELLDRSETCVSQVERGTRTIDRLSVLGEVARVLDVPANEVAVARAHHSDGRAATCCNGCRGRTTSRPSRSRATPMFGRWSATWCRTRVSGSPRTAAGWHSGSPSFPRPDQRGSR